MAGSRQISVSWLCPAGVWVPPLQRFSRLPLAWVGRSLHSDRSDASVVASLAVQLVRSMQTAQAVAPAQPSAVQPVVAHQATLWQDLGSR
jgi:hypothetical protein